MKNKKKSLFGMSLLSVGVVYGDIGTSPLYAFKAAFHGQHSLVVNQANVLGVLSLIFWMFVLVVSTKYLLLVTRVNNNGEGGILTLSSLAMQQTHGMMKKCILTLGMLATGFFFGEAIITPAMSVLSAVEGVEVVTKKLSPYIMPIALTMILLLFAIQSYGTEKIGKLFSPIMVLWFLTIALLGVRSIADNPIVFNAVNPKFAVEFIFNHKLFTIYTLSVVVLAVTGVEALYADMGHFGIEPIKMAWFTLIMPSLVLNYYGQGALILTDSSNISNPFFLLAPKSLMLPLVILSTVATVIASQAVISSMFSITRQAINYGYLPPVRVLHTSHNEIGQIYVPIANFFLFISVVIVILIFQHSNNLAAAYGIAVTLTMMVTSILFSLVAMNKWKWSQPIVVQVMILMLCIDLPLFLSTTLKIENGGWLPIVIGLCVFSLMWLWKDEKSKLVSKAKMSHSAEAVAYSLERKFTSRVKGTAVYLSREEGYVPQSLLNNIQHNKVLHERVVFLTCIYDEKPRIHPMKRVKVKQISPTFWSVTAYYGYKEEPDIESALYSCYLSKLYFHLDETVFFVSSERIKIKEINVLHDAKARMFVFLSKNALRTSEKLKIPKDHLVELGVQLEI
ncbi:potassium transporter Kup [Photobacterium profundum]|uniref:Probable potassium transport system protein Kup n=1 Tax=Photobacterium profundum 3TCK TaxID=314280 RepID=Q1Z634_9GAMM|nr:potassium transporter Kup [Photobacterium profundum]EAS44010.1 potassium uptake protein, Kup system [Photobacterium profundum 3TCK]PSV61799.1 potassium transporter Kup [Photobacterium profundum]